MFWIPDAGVKKAADTGSGFATLVLNDILGQEPWLVNDSKNIFHNFEIVSCDCGSCSGEMWERGVAYKKHGELYAVLAVDLGTRHQAALSELRPLPDSAKSLPACAIQVTSVGDLGLPDADSLVRGMDPDPDPSLFL